MDMVDIIEKKKTGKTLTEQEIQYFVNGFTAGSIPDYQASALLMAICFKHMNKRETIALTTAMRESGNVIDLSAIAGIKVDKHSTGGVGDKTTLIVGPLAAAAGVPIAKMSGRGLGFTGGTIDKLESIPGFRTSMEETEFIEHVNRIGIAVTGQTAHIAPADKKIYALRDVTATVNNLSLVASSVMSKKLGSGSDAIVLDVKCGKGAFMETLEEATRLGELMVEIGNSAHKKTIAVITDMNQPLGKAIGNSLEVMEAIDTLKGKGPRDITELSLTLAAYMIFAGGKAKDEKEGRMIAEEALQRGTGLKKFSEFVRSQGGDDRIVEDYSLLPQSTCCKQVIPSAEVLKGNKAFIASMDAKQVGLASQHAGAGRMTKDDSIDLGAGILLHKQVGDAIQEGETLATILSTSEEQANRGAEEFMKGISFSEKEPCRRDIVLKVI